MNASSLDKIKYDWFLLCKSKNIKVNEIKSYKIFNTPIVLFRKKNGICHALIDRCAHRNVPLSKGTLIDDCLQCPYHGWHFDSQGKCTKIPGMLSENIPNKIVIPRLSVKEQHGFIWISLNPNNETSPSFIPYNQDSLYDTFLVEFHAQATFQNLLENFLDSMHTHFVHPGLVRKDNLRKKVQVTLNRQPDSIEACYQDESKSSGIISKWFEKERSKSYGRFILPSIGQLEYRSENNLNMMITGFILPIEEQKQKVTAFITTKKGILPYWMKKILLFPLLRKALNQDLHILNLQRNNIDQFQGEEHFQYTKLDLIRPHINKLLIAEKDKIEPMISQIEIEI